MTMYGASGSVDAAAASATLAEPMRPAGRPGRARRSSATAPDRSTRPQVGAEPAHDDDRRTVGARATASSAIDLERHDAPRR